MKWVALFVIAVFAGGAATAAAPMPAYASFFIDAALLEEIRCINVYTSRLQGGKGCALPGRC